MLYLCTLKAYREVFDYFIEGFKTYKPLLSAIKNEYEITLGMYTLSSKNINMLVVVVTKQKFLKLLNVIAVYLQQQIQELEPLRAQMVLLSEQCEEKILGLREHERAEITALKQQRQHLQQVVGSMKEQQRALQTQVGHLFWLQPHAPLGKNKLSHTHK